MTEAVPLGVACLGLLRIKCMLLFRTSYLFDSIVSPTLEQIGTPAIKTPEFAQCLLKHLFFLHMFSP